MGYKYDAVLVLSSNLDHEGNLTRYSISRIEEAFRVYAIGETNRIALSGSTSQQMKEYLIQKNVFDGAISLEDFSKDTLGNAVFSKLVLALPNVWRNILVVSSDFHIPRVRKIFDFVYGCDFQVNYYGTQFNGGIDFSRKERESLQTFRETFEGIQAGDDTMILKRLFERHELYKKDEDLKRRFMV